MKSTEHTSQRPGQAAQIHGRSQSAGRRIVGTLLDVLSRRRRKRPDVRPARRRQPWGKGTGRASYAVVQRRRAANRVARKSRRINRATR